MQFAAFQRFDAIINSLTDVIGGEENGANIKFRAVRRLRIRGFNNTADKIMTISNCIFGSTHQKLELKHNVVVGLDQGFRKFLAPQKPLLN